MDVELGDLVVVEAEPGGLRRVALVVGKRPSHLTMLLCSNETWMASDLDLIVRPSMVSYALLVDAELYFVALAEQVVKVIGSVTEAERVAIVDSLLTDGESLVGFEHGALPLSPWPDDPRRYFKSTELGVAMVLRQQAHRMLMPDG